MSTSCYLPNWCFLFVLLLPTNSALSQEAVHIPSVFEHLTQEENPQLTIDLDLTYLMHNRKDFEYQKAALKVDATGETFGVEIRIRGKYRLKFAEVPPLKLKFKKRGLAEKGLDTLNEIKLVLPMRTDAKGEEMLLREYAAYRMFEQLSPFAFRARLVQLRLRDTEVPTNILDMKAILLEHDEELCARLQAVEVDSFGIQATALQPEQAALVTLFEYMIGNTDWEIASVRNVKLLRTEGQEKLVVVPYDFDFSGFVDAPYAVPSTESGLRNVRDRTLMAQGIDVEYLLRAVEVFKARKEPIMSVCMLEGLRKSAVNDMLSCLNGFYKRVEDSNISPKTINGFR
jgi:hypothetical protein